MKDDKPNTEIHRDWFSFIEHPRDGTNSKNCYLSNIKDYYPILKLGKKPTQEKITLDYSNVVVKGGDPGD